MNTEIILPVTELKTALSGLNKIVGKKTTLPVLSCVKVSRDKNGEVSLQGTDLDAHATFTFNNTQQGGPVDILMPLEQLNKAAKSSSNDDMLALICENKTTKLRYFIGGNPVHQPVNTLPMKEWVPCPEITVASTPLQPSFGEALKQAMQCCSQDESRYVLRGACLDARDPKAHYIVGTNGRFMYSANSFVFPFKDAVIIPDSKFINGSDLLNSESCLLAIQPLPVDKTEVKPPVKDGKPVPEPEPPKLICLQSRQWQFVTRDIEGNYPSWKQVVPTINGDYTLVKLSETALKQLLKVIPNMPGLDGFDNKIRLRVGETLLIEGKSKDDEDWTSIAISDVTITGKYKEICLNRNYLLPALKFGLDEVAILDEFSAMVASKEGKKVVIMPLRFEGSAPEPATPEPTPQSGPAPATSPSTTTPSASDPPTTEVTFKTEERTNEMARTTTTTTPPTPTTTETAATPDSPFKLAMEQVDQLRDSVKNVLRSLTTIADTLKLAEKEKKAGDKEILQFRDKLREIQGIKL